MRTAKPLTVREKRQLDAWNANADRAMLRGYLMAGGLGLLGGAGLVGWMMKDGGTVTFDELPFLRPVADVVGPTLAMALFAGVLFAGGMLLVMWRIAGVTRSTHAQLQARYLAAGAEGEPPR